MANTAGWTRRGGSYWEASNGWAVVRTADGWAAYGPDGEIASTKRWPNSLTARQETEKLMKG